MRFHLGILGLCILGLACKKPQSDARVEPAPAPVSDPIPTIHAASLPSAPPTIETVEVPNDKKVLVMVGEDTKRPIVHLHGMCTDAKSDLDAWASAVSKQGTIIALEGDSKCEGGATWSTDIAALDRRIGNAIEAVVGKKHVDLDQSATVLIGESMGATRATALASKYPQKYSRLILIGTPETPSAKDLGQAKAVAIVAGSNEPQEKMRQGLQGLASGGIKARFWELQGANHGDYGNDAHRQMGEAVMFVAQ